MSIAVMKLIRSMVNYLNRSKPTIIPKAVEVSKKIMAM
jgi:hypothetical protein